MAAVIFHGLAWPTLGVALLVFGFAPGAALRMILLCYPKGHPRRQELLAELYAVPRIERPFWVAQQLEIALFEGLRGRFSARSPSTGGHRGLRFAAGAVVVGLIVLDGIPLNWVAQAFGLNQAATWLMTLLLVAASAAAMLGFHLTRQPRRRGLLAAVVTVGYLALLVLRAVFLVEVAAESLPVAILQAALLVAVSAGLVLCASAVLARIAPRLTGEGDHPRHPTRRRGLGFAAGAVVVGLIVLDGIPLNWVAQAFGLTLSATWLMTLLLVAASAAAMLGFHLTRQPRRRGLLAAVVTVGYLALLVLRAVFLVEVAAESLPVAILQAALLVAVSAGLVLCASAVLARITPRLTG